jgi:hypothetical protein
MHAANVGMTQHVTQLQVRSESSSVQSPSTGKVHSSALIASCRLSNVASCIQAIETPRNRNAQHAMIECTFLLAHRRKGGSRRRSRARRSRCSNRSTAIPKSREKSHEIAKSVLQRPSALRDIATYPS